MSKTLFDFSEMVVECVRTEDFTNSVKEDKFKLILANFLITVQNYSQRNLVEMTKVDKHCHEIKKDYLKLRIGKLINWKDKEIEELRRKLIWQIPIGEEARLFGIIKKVKYPNISHIFQVLLFDPNHKTYRKGGKNVLVSLKNTICLFNQDDECFDQHRFLHEKDC